MSRDLPLVTLIIPNYNGSEYLKKFLRTVFNTRYPLLEIIFVDDGSTDDSVDIVKKMSENNLRLRVIKHGENLGLAYARNTGIKAAKGDIIAFLDNDIEVDPEWLIELVKVLQNNEKIGVAMSKTYDMKCRNRLQSFGQLIVPYIGWTISIGYGIKDGQVFENVREVYACLNAVAIKREVFEKIGLIDTNMTYLWEDIDFEYRVWLAGYKEVVVPASKVFHYAKPPRKREITYKWNQFRKDFLSKNFLYFMLKNYEVKSLVRFLLVALFIHLLRAIDNLVRGETSCFWSLTREIMWNLKNLSMILHKRKNVQKMRIVTDNSIFSKVGLMNPMYLLKYHKYAKVALKRYFL